MMQGIAIFRRGSKRWFTVFTYSYHIYLPCGPFGNVFTKNFFFSFSIVDRFKISKQFGTIVTFFCRFPIKLLNYSILILHLLFIFFSLSCKIGGGFWVWFWLFFFTSKQYRYPNSKNDITDFSKLLSEKYLHEKLI
jgi:hypothetical protein